MKETKKAKKISMEMLLVSGVLLAGSGWFLFNDKPGLALITLLFAVFFAWRLYKPITAEEAERWWRMR